LDIAGGNSLFRRKNAAALSFSLKSDSFCHPALSSTHSLSMN